MGKYLTRYIEVKVKSNGDSASEYEWKLVKWLEPVIFESDSKSNYILGDNGNKYKERYSYYDCSILRDDFIEKYEDRGYPEDMSEELKDILKKEKEIDKFDFTYNHCSLTLYELYNEFEKATEMLKESIYKQKTDNKLEIINDKLDLLFDKVKSPYDDLSDELKRIDTQFDSDDEYYESTDYIIDDQMELVDAISNEIKLVKHLTKSAYNYPKDENIRIIYNLG